MLYEFGFVAPRGRKIVVRWVAEHRVQIEQQVPALVVQLMDQQLQMLRDLDERILSNERCLQQVGRADESIRALLKVPGIGPLGASARAVRPRSRRRIAPSAGMKKQPSTGRSVGSFGHRPVALAALTWGLRPHSPNTPAGPRCG
jgi:transposase